MRATVGRRPGAAGAGGRGRRAGRRRSRPASACPPSALPPARGPARRARRRGAPARGRRRPSRRRRPRLALRRRERLAGGSTPTRRDPVGWALPLHAGLVRRPAGRSARWRTRRGRLVLLPGDSPAGLRLPLELGRLDASPDYAGEPSLRSHRRRRPVAAGRPAAGASWSTRSRSPDATALCVEERDGIVHVFLPPLEQLERCARAGRRWSSGAAAQVGVPVVLEGYAPAAGPAGPHAERDPRPGRDRGQRRTRRQLGGAAATHRTRLYALAAERRAGHREVRPRRDAHRHRRRQPHHPRRRRPRPTSPLLRRPDLLVSMLTYWQHHPVAVLPLLRPVHRPDQPGAPGRRGPARDPLRAGDRVRRARAKAPPRTTTAPPRRGQVRPGAAAPADRHHRQHPPRRVLHRQDVQPGLRARPARAARAARLRDAAAPRHGPGAGAAGPRAWSPGSGRSRTRRRWSAGAPALHDGSCCRTSSPADLGRRGRRPARPRPRLRRGLARRRSSSSASRGSGVDRRGRRSSSCARRSSRGTSWARRPRSGGTARFVDSSVERLQVARPRLRAEPSPAHLQRRRRCRCTPTATPGSTWPACATGPGRRGPRCTRRSESTRPLVFDLVDRGTGVSLGGCTYHVVHPGGRAFEQLPVNAHEAEARRAAPVRGDGPHPRARSTSPRSSARAAVARRRRHGVPADARPAAPRPRRGGGRGLTAAPSATGAADGPAGRRRRRSPGLRRVRRARRAASAPGLGRPGRGPAVLTATRPASARGEAARLLENDGVTYTPARRRRCSIADPARPPSPPAAPLAEPRPWQLDPLPLLLPEREWARSEAGLVQRAELLDAVLTDLYGARRLLAERPLPPEVVLRPRRVPAGRRPGAAPRRPASLFMAAADLGRDADGAWIVMGDRTQAPSGAGYAMENRRVVSRVLPELYHAAHLHRLTPFFHAMRLALVEAAPGPGRGPARRRADPGTRRARPRSTRPSWPRCSATRCVEGSDLTVRDGRVWMRALGRLEQVDVILRRVDSTWTRPARAARPAPSSASPGCWSASGRARSASSTRSAPACVENPALLPFLPELCERAARPAAAAAVGARPGGAATRWLAAHVAGPPRRPGRPADQPGHGRSVRALALTRQSASRLVARIEAEPHRFVGQQVLQLSRPPRRPAAPTGLVPSAAWCCAPSPSADGGSLHRDARRPRPGQRRAPRAAVRPGHRARTAASPRTSGSWRASRAPAASPAPRPRRGGQRRRARSSRLRGDGPAGAGDLFWFGRYAERAEDLLRLVLAIRTVAIETDMDTAQGHALEVLLQALTQVTTTYPGFLAPAGRQRRAALMPELRSLMLDRHRPGTVAQSLQALTAAAAGRPRPAVRRRLDGPGRRRARLGGAGRPARRTRGCTLDRASERVLSGLLALAGHRQREHGPRRRLAAARRRPRAGAGDAGAGLLRATCASRPAADVDAPGPRGGADRRRVDRHLPPPLPGTGPGAGRVELLVTDACNPRSVAYQVERMLATCGAIPNASPTARPLRLARRAWPSRSARPTRSPCCVVPPGDAVAGRPAGRDAAGGVLRRAARGCGTCRRPSATTYHAAAAHPQPMSLPRRQVASERSEPGRRGAVTIPDRAHHPLRLRRRRHRQLRAVPPAAARPRLAAAACRTR